jgi:hypothetical protein
MEPRLSYRGVLDSWNSQDLSAKVYRKKYRASLYDRLERSIGWFLFFVGIIILLIYGSFKTVNCIVKDSSITLLQKIGILGIIGGIVILMVSLIKEQLFIYLGKKKENGSLKGE